MNAPSILTGSALGFGIGAVDAASILSADRIQGLRARTFSADRCLDAGTEPGGKMSD